MIDIESDGICDEIDNCIGTWIEDIETGPCNMFADESTCISFGCSWTNEYTGVWLWEDVCGWGNQTYELDNSYCEQNEYQLGDLNQDSLINIQDVIVAINLILYGEFDSSADINLDSTVNVLDVIQIVNIILNN